MSLTRDDSVFLHVARSLGLVTLSLICLPASLALVLAAKTLTSLSLIKIPKPSPALRDGHQIRVLVTGVGMAKGLFLARALYEGGCVVISADFEAPYVPVCGRYSHAITRFYSLRAVRSAQEPLDYLEQMMQIIQSERIEIWVSCSGVATAIEDAKLMEAVQRKTACKVFQFNEASTFTLDNKFEFMKATADLALTVPRWFPLHSADGIDQIVNKATNVGQDSNTTLYMLKNVAMDDRTRGTLPLLSSKEPERMREILRGLDFDGANWIVQQFIPGSEEYCTHSVVIEGHVVAFLACPSASVLMHYRLLDPDSPAHDAMLKFTQKYASTMYKKHGHFSGHLSFDFLALNEPVEQGLKKTLMPIECNPRCHTAVVHLRDYEKELTLAYTSILSSQKDVRLLVPSDIEPPRIYFWVAHDLVALYILPILQCLAGYCTLREAILQHLDFWRHITIGKDPTFEWWDPLPFLVLYHVYWPGRLLSAIFSGLRWSQLNVSTGKMFEI